MLKGLLFNFKVIPDAGLAHGGFSIILFIWLLAAVELFQWRKHDLLAVFKAPAGVRVLFYVCGYLLLAAYGNWGDNAFIYFQF